MNSSVFYIEQHVSSGWLRVSTGYPTPSKATSALLRLQDKYPGIQYQVKEYRRV